MFVVCQGNTHTIESQDVKERSRIVYNKGVGEVVTIIKRNIT